jgi:hypothetical protein
VVDLKAMLLLRPGAHAEWELRNLKFDRFVAAIL